MIHKPLCGGIRIDLVVYEFADAGPPDLDDLVLYVLGVTKVS